MTEPVSVARERIREEFSWMSEGTFRSFWTSYRMLQQLQDDHTVTADQARQIMGYVTGATGKPNVTEFRRQVYALGYEGRLPMELTRYKRSPDAAEAGSDDAKTALRSVPAKPATKLDQARERLRSLYPWMSDATFALYWKSIRMLRFLELAGMITHDEAEQVRLSVPRSSTTGKPSIAEFSRRVAELEQRAKTEYARRNQSLPPLVPLPEVSAPVTAGRRLVATAMEGRKLTLSWVADETR